MCETVPDSINQIEEPSRFTDSPSFLVQKENRELLNGLPTKLMQNSVDLICRLDQR